MTSRVLIVSYMLFGLMLVGLVWGDTWLPRSAQLAVIASTAVVWLVSVHVLFRQLRLPLRAKIVGWFLVAIFVIYDAVSTVASYYYWHDLWSQWIALDVAGMLFFLSSVGLLALLLRERSAPTVVPPYTVESEAPDHVLHVSSTPNYSLKRTAARRHGLY